MNDLEKQIGAVVIALLIGAGLGAFVMHWFDSDSPVTVTRTIIQKVPVNVPVAAPVAPQLASAPIAPVKMQTCTVQAYAAPAKMRQHLLPKPIADNQKQAIVASSRVEPDDHPETITATIDTDTGQAMQSVVREPLPWLAQDKQGDAGIYVGYQDSIPTARIEVRQGLVQVKSLHVGLIASADQPLNGGRLNLFGGIGAWAKW